MKAVGEAGGELIGVDEDSMHLTLRIIYKEYEKDYISNRIDSTRGLRPSAVPLCGIPFHRPHICSNNGV